MNVIPVPRLIETRIGCFQLPRDFAVGYDDVRCTPIYALLEDGIRQNYGFSCQVRDSCVNPHVKLKLLEKMSSLGEVKDLNEAYELIVSEECITIYAEKTNGLFYGIQSFFQLLPFDAKLNEDPITIHCIKVKIKIQFLDLCLCFRLLMYLDLDGEGFCWMLDVISSMLSLLSDFWIIWHSTRSIDFIGI